MSVRSFWTILIKILGIWLVLNSVLVIPQYFSSTYYSYSFSGSDDSSEGLLLSFTLMLLTVLIYVFVLWLFVFKTAWLIDKLQLEKGFDEEKIDFNFNQSAVLSIAVIVIGAMIFISGLPSFCKEVFNLMQMKYVFRESPKSGWILFYMIETFTGYLLMTNSKTVVNYIDKKSA